MRTSLAFAMGQANRGNELMVFDWHKAAEICKRAAAKGKNVEAYLYSDREFTGGCILLDKEPYMDDYTYLASTWAEPMIQVDGQAPKKCYLMQSETPGWDAHTKWPDSALAIFNKQEG